MIKYNDAYEAEIRAIIRENPRNYVRVLKSRGFRGRCPDRTYLVEYIYQCTPLLVDGVHTFKTRVYWTLNRMSDFPFCMNDKNGKHRMETANVKKIEDGYPQYCDSACQHEAPSYHEKTRKAMLEKYGVENAFQIESVKRGLAERKEEIQVKRDATYKTHFGNAPGRNAEKSLKTRMERYGSAWNISKIKKVKAVRYGNPDWNNPVKNSNTKKINGTFNESAQEQTAFEVLRLVYPDLERQHRDRLYPFNCDFYSAAADKYIEYNGSWTHGGRPFSGSAEDNEIVSAWKNRKSRYYDNAVKTWTERDPRKRAVAAANKLDFTEIWNLEQLESFAGLAPGSLIGYPVIPYSKTLADREIAHYRKMCSDAGRLSRFSARSQLNYIVKYFQQDSFYAAEKAMWLDNESRLKIIRNRCEYLGKRESELTPLNILDGFKRSGEHYGYSHFNPQWFARFISMYGAKTCYDPCGGWGHRVMGSFALDRYIYNDLSKTTKLNVDRMTKRLKLDHVETYCEDARTFVPDRSFDSMFTCPPYFNVERYECGGFFDMADYNLFIDSLFSVFEHSPDCRVFGLVLREDLIGKHTGYAERFEIPVKSAAHFKINKTNSEYMYVYLK